MQDWTIARAECSSFRFHGNASQSIFYQSYNGFQILTTDSCSPEFLRLGWRDKKPKVLVLVGSLLLCPTSGLPRRLSLSPGLSPTAASFPPVTFPTAFAREAVLPPTSVFLRAVPIPIPIFLFPSLSPSPTILFLLHALSYIDAALAKSLGQVVDLAVERFLITQGC